MTLPLDLARDALAGDRAWLVGGVLRDRALGRDASDDIDLVVDGDPRRAARALSAAARDDGRRVACFELSRDFGAWRVVCRREGWQIDVEPLRGGSLEADLRLRDFTVNAVAEPIGGGALIDPLGGLGDLAARRLRAAGPSAFVDDPLRVLRLARIALELDLEPDSDTIRLAAASAPALPGVAGERVFAELARTVDSPSALAGLRLLERLGAIAAVLPELRALEGVDQSRFHHLDVHGHTLEVLEHAIALQADPAGVVGLDSDSPLAAELRSLLLEPLGDGLTRGSALRWGALLHDIAKPPTRAVRPSDGRVTFIGHDELGAHTAATILRRLRASERLVTHVAALVREHLRLGFLVHEPQPLARRTVFAYLSATEPVEVDVTLLSIADRLATRGDRAIEAIAEHLALAREMLEAALAWRRAGGAPKPLLRGDELARAVGIEPGPKLGELLRALAQAQYAGEIDGGRERAIEYARSLLGREAAR